MLYPDLFDSRRTRIGANYAGPTSVHLDSPAPGNVHGVPIDQAERLAKLRAGRDSAEFKRRIDDVRHAAEGTGNLLYPLREALRARATVGEVCDALRDAWGVYKPPDAY